MIGTTSVVKLPCSFSVTSILPSNLICVKQWSKISELIKGRSTLSVKFSHCWRISTGEWDACDYKKRNTTFQNHEDENKIGEFNKINHDVIIIIIVQNNSWSDLSNSITEFPRPASSKVFLVLYYLLWGFSSGILLSPLTNLIWLSCICCSEIFFFGNFVFN